MVLSGNIFIHHLARAYAAVKKKIRSLMRSLQGLPNSNIMYKNQLSYFGILTGTISSLSLFLPTVLTSVLAMVVRCEPAVQIFFMVRPEFSSCCVYTHYLMSQMDFTSFSGLTIGRMIIDPLSHRGPWVIELCVHPNFCLKFTILQ